MPKSECMLNHHMNTVCPICGFVKDNRALWCKSCRCASGLNRLGTGKCPPFKGNGYVFVFQPDHPKANRWGYINEAILALEERLGRHLLPGMHCHHINGIRDDNRPENLLELSAEEHPKHHKRFKGWTWQVINNRRVWLCPL